jgi:O-antigen ligase
LFFVLLLAHAKKDSKAMLICLYGIAFGCILQSILATMGVGVEINPVSMRLELFGMNPNSTGIMMCMGFIIIFSEFVMRDCLRLGVWRFLFLLTAIPISATIVLTGSRTAVVLFVVAIIVILFFNPVKSKFLKYAVIILGTVALFFAAQKFMTEDNVLVERIKMSTESGDLSGRDALWKDIVPAISENPIWGYGETGYYGFVANKALGVELSPHNVFLEVLALTGMIGLIMWLIFWFRIFSYAWYTYKKEKILLPMLMLLPMMVCLFSGQFITVSWAYILYAYVISEYHNIHGKINLNKVTI